MPLSDAQKAALNRLQSFYEGDNPYNSVTNPGGFRQGGHLYNFVPALKDLATVIVGAAALAVEVAANSAQSPKAVRVDSAQAFTQVERQQGKINLGAGGRVTGFSQPATLDPVYLNSDVYLVGDNYTVKMPAVGATANGDAINFLNIGGGTITLSHSDNDAANFVFAGVNRLTVTLGPGQSLRAISDTSNWVCAFRAIPPEFTLNANALQVFSPGQRGLMRSSLKLAGSAFVYSGGNRSLTKDDVGTVFYTDSTQTITLPLVSDCAVGDTIEFYVTAGTLTLAQPAGNAYAIGTPGPGGGQTIALTAGAYVLKRADVAWRLHNAPNNAVQRSGDTMTGDLTIVKSAGYAGLRMVVQGKADHLWRAIDNGRMQLCDGGQTVEYFSIGTDGAISTRQVGDLYNFVQGVGSTNQNAAVNRSVTYLRMVYLTDQDITVGANQGIREDYGGGVITGRTSITSGDGNDIIIRNLRYRQVQFIIPNNGWIAASYA